MADTTGDSPQKRGAAAREAKRKAAQAQPPTGTIKEAAIRVDAERRAAQATTEPVSDSVRMLFAVTQEEDMLAVSRTLRAIGRVHTVDVSPYGFVLTRTAD